MCGINAAINRVCGANPSGIARLALANYKDVLTIPVASVLDHTVFGNITMQPIDPLLPLGVKKKFFNVEFTEEKAEFDEEMVGGENGGEQLQVMIKIAIPNREKVLVAKYQRLIGGRYIALVTFVDGSIIVVGSTLVPLKIKKMGSKSGKQGSNDVKETIFEFGASSGNLAYYYEGSDYDTLVEGR